MQNRSVLDGVVVEPGVQQPLRIRTPLEFVVGAEFLLVRMDVENGMELGFHNGDQLVGGHVEGSEPSRGRGDHLNLHHVAGETQSGTVVDCMIVQPAVRENCPTVGERHGPARTQSVHDDVFDVADGVVELDRQGEARTSRGPHA